MTDEWLEGQEAHIAIITVHRGDSTVYSCSDYIFPTHSEWVSVSPNLISGLLRKRKVFGWRAGLTPGPTLCSHLVAQSLSFLT